MDIIRRASWFPHFRFRLGPLHEKHNIILKSFSQTRLFLQRKTVRRSAGILLVLLTLYLFGYGAIYRLGDNNEGLRRVILIACYPINYIRAYNGFIYDLTEYSYRIFGGVRPIEERCREFGFHRKWHRKVGVYNYYTIYHNGNPILDYKFDYDYKSYRVDTMCNGHWKTNCYYYNGRCALTKEGGQGKAFWDNGVMFASWTYDEERVFRPIDGLVPQMADTVPHPPNVALDYSNLDNFEIELVEYKDGKVIRRIADLTTLGATHEQILKFKQTSTNMILP